LRSRLDHARRILTGYQRKPITPTAFARKELPHVRTEEKECKHRGGELGWIECGCGGRPILYACGSPDVPEVYCLLHAANKPMGTLHFHGSDAKDFRKLRDIPVCAVCKFREPDEVESSLPRQIEIGQDHAAVEPSAATGQGTREPQANQQAKSPGQTEQNHGT
jgi:hypothetical protein